MAGDAPDWQGGVTLATTASPAPATYTLAAGARQTVLAGLPGVTISLITIFLSVIDNTGADIAIEDTAGHIILIYRSGGGSLVAVPMYGYPVPVGEGIQVHNFGAGAMVSADAITIHYQQA